MRNNSENKIFKRLHASFRSVMMSCLDSMQYTRLHRGLRLPTACKPWTVLKKNPYFQALSLVSDVHLSPIMISCLDLMQNTRPLAWFRKLLAWAVLSLASFTCFRAPKSFLWPQTSLPELPRYLALIHCLTCFDSSQYTHEWVLSVENNFPSKPNRYIPNSKPPQATAHLVGGFIWFLPLHWITCCEMSSWRLCWCGGLS